MLLTKALKDHAEASLGVAPGSTDQQYAEAIAKALATGIISPSDPKGITPEKYKELSENSAATQIKSMITDQVKSAMAEFGTSFASKLDEVVNAVKGGTASTATKTEAQKSLEDQLNAIVKEALEKHGIKPEETGTDGAPGSQKGTITGKGTALGGDDGQTRVEHIHAYKQYDGTRRGAFIKGYGKNSDIDVPATHFGKSLNHPSQLDRALCGAFFKWEMANQLKTPSILNDHDRELVHYLMNECKWSGFVGGQGEIDTINDRKLTDIERKGLLEDSTSGGSNAIPIVFDEQVVLQPILQGEFYPLVTVVPLTRGSHVQGFAMGIPTIGNTAEGTAITPFNTASFISAFNTTVYPAVGAMEIGLDFASDSPVDIGQLVLQRYGEAMMHWLDRVIAVGGGSGSSEPLGMTGTSGAITVSAISGTSGPLTISDAEGLMFGVTKKYRAAKGGKCVFFGAETAYRRFRAVRVGTSDARRVFGMDHAKFTLLENPYKVCEETPNGTIGYANLGFYRMYRRLGMQLRIETAGRTLALSNNMLVVLRARYGGQMELGGAVALMTNAAINNPTSG